MQLLFPVLEKKIHITFNVTLNIEKLSQDITASAWKSTPFIKF